MPRTAARLLLLPLAGLITGAAAAPPAPSAPPASASPPASAAALGTEFDRTIRPLLQKHCYECHGADKQEGGVSFADLKPGIAALRSRALWRRSGSQVRSGDMPPDDAKHPLPPADKQAFVAWAKSAVDALAVDPRNPDPGPALARRLNRTEYDNTIRDLLGVPMDSATEAGIPDEEVVDGFDTLATALTLSPALLEKYLSAADVALDKVFGSTDGKTPPPKTPRPPGGGAARQGGKSTGKPGAFDPQAAVDRIITVRPAAGVTPRDAASQDLAKFMRRAYRRPVKPAEVDRLLPLVDDALAAGKPFEQAVRAALKPVLASPHFLLRVERDRPAAAAGRLGVDLDDHELASRLSYFLWSTMPDDELSALADAGKLRDPAVYDAQVKRMLADPRGKALTDNFAAQWLHLKKVAAARPSTEFFPTFTPKLRQAMADEMSAFFDHLRTEDRSVVELIDADYTFVSADLAKHYGIDGVTGPELKRVALKPELHRGGLLGMGGVLALTSHTSRTSPTQRGKYVLEVILGTPPPPPPPNVGQIDNNKRGKKGEPQTFREQLAAHATQKSCAGCHAKIDPLGFALDNYDAVGAWRDSTKDNPLDTTGVLPGGQKIDGVAELKRVLLDRKDEFVRNLAEQMLTYATGRRTDYFDEPTIRGTAEAAKANGYRFSEIVKGVATSPAFKMRRAAGVE